VFAGREFLEKKLHLSNITYKVQDHRRKSCFKNGRKSKFLHCAHLGLFHLDKWNAKGLSDD